MTNDLDFSALVRQVAVESDSACGPAQVGPARTLTANFSLLQDLPAQVDNTIGHFDESKAFMNLIANYSSQDDNYSLRPNLDGFQVGGAEPSQASLRALGSSPPHPDAFDLSHAVEAGMTPLSIPTPSAGSGAFDVLPLASTPDAVSCRAGATAGGASSSQPTPRARAETPAGKTRGGNINRWKAEEIGELVDQMQDRDTVGMTGPEWETVALAIKSGPGRKGTAAKCKWDKLVKEGTLQQADDGEWIIVPREKNEKQVIPKGAKRKAAEAAAAAVKKEQRRRTESPKLDDHSAQPLAEAATTEPENVTAQPPIERDDKEMLVHCLAGPQRKRATEQQQDALHQQLIVNPRPLDIPLNTSEGQPWSSDEEAVLLSTVCLWSAADWTVIADLMGNHRAADECKRKFLQIGSTGTNGAEATDWGANFMTRMSRDGTLGDGKTVFDLNQPLPPLDPPTSSDLRWSASPATVNYPVTVLSTGMAPPAMSAQGSPPSTGTSNGNLNFYPTPDSQHSALQSPPADHSPLRDSARMSRASGSGSSLGLSMAESVPVTRSFGSNEGSWLSQAGEQSVTYHQHAPSGGMNYLAGQMSPPAPKPRVMAAPLTPALSPEQMRRELAKHFIAHGSAPSPAVSTHQPQMAIQTSPRPLNAVGGRIPSSHGRTASFSAGLGGAQAQAPLRRSSTGPYVYGVGNGNGNGNGSGNSSIHQPTDSVYVAYQPPPPPTPTQARPTSNAFTREQLTALLQQNPHLARELFQQQQDQAMRQQRERQRQQQLAMEHYGLVPKSHPGGYNLNEGSFPVTNDAYAGQQSPARFAGNGGPGAHPQRDSIEAVEQFYAQEGHHQAQAALFGNEQYEISPGSLANSGLESSSTLESNSHSRAETNKRPPSSESNGSSNGRNNKLKAVHASEIELVQRKADAPEEPATPLSSAEEDGSEGSKAQGTVAMMSPISTEAGSSKRYPLRRSNNIK